MRVVWTRRSCRVVVGQSFLCVKNHIVDLKKTDRPEIRLELRTPIGRGYEALVDHTLGGDTLSLLSAEPATNVVDSDNLDGPARWGAWPHHLICFPLEIQSKRAIEIEANSPPGRWMWYLKLRSTQLSCLERF